MRSDLLLTRLKCLEFTRERFFQLRKRKEFEFCGIYNAIITRQSNENIRIEVCQLASIQERGCGALIQ